MKLKFEVSVSGPAYSFSRGETATMDDREEAARLVKAGYAVEVKPEKATKKKAPEKAVK